MKITKTLSKDFFNLIKDENNDTFEQSLSMLKNYPGLANEIVRGMAKGIDGFSSLMLAIRYYNFKFAIELVKAGADVNYIDSSTARQRYYPVFFDLLEMLKNMIEVKKYEHVKEGISLWEFMESSGLDYSKKSIANDGVNKPENCLEAFIRIASTIYERKHKIHNETKYEPPATYCSTYILNQKSRDLEKEKWYDLIMENITGRINESLVKEMDANRHRNSGNIFKTSSGYFEMIDNFSLYIANKHVKLKFGYSIKNMDDNSIIEVYKDTAKHLIVDPQ